MTHYLVMVQVHLQKLIQKSGMHQRILITVAPIIKNFFGTINYKKPKSLGYTMILKRMG